MIAELICFVLTALVGSLCFLGCHTLTAYTADPRQFLNRPLLMHRHSWIGTVAGLFSIFVFVLVPLNGWLIWSWIGAITLTVFWLYISNPLIKFLTTYRSTMVTMIVSNPFYQLFVGIPLLVVLTVLNFTLH